MSDLQTQVSQPEAPISLVDCSDAVKKALITAEKHYGSALKPATLLLLLALREIDADRRVAAHAEQRKTAGGAQ